LAVAPAKDRLVSAWLLVGWLATMPEHRETLGTFTTIEQCQSRVLWLSETRSKRRNQRYYDCLEVPQVCAAPSVSPP
jgi:hypothetical protein